MRIIVAAFALVSCLNVGIEAASTPITLTVGTNSPVDFTLSYLSFFDTQQSLVNGQIDVDLEWQPSGNDIEVIGFTILNASLTSTDVVLQPTPAFPPFVGTNLGSTMFTPLPPGAVIPGGTMFDAAYHQVSINGGTIVNGGTTVDLAIQPITGVNGGTGGITLTELFRNGNDVLYDIQVAVPVNFSGALGGFPLLLSGAGTLPTSSAMSVTVPEPNTIVMGLLLSVVALVIRNQR